MDNQPTRFLTFEEVQARTTLSRMSIRRLLAHGDDRFPQPVRLGGRRVAWRSTDIDAFIDGCATPSPGQES
jgi:prophage regulatory protein